MILNTFIYVAHIIISICIIALVLVQQGKGADAGAAFGSGASGTVFGAAGKSNFLAKITKWFVILFFLTSLFMMFQAGKIKGTSDSVFDTISEVPTTESNVPYDNSIPKKDEQ